MGVNHRVVSGNPSATGEEWRSTLCLVMDSGSSGISALL